MKARQIARALQRATRHIRIRHGLRADDAVCTAQQRFYRGVRKSIAAWPGINIASGPRSKPSHRAGAPSGLRPTPPLALAARPRRPIPTRSPLRSSASNRVSRHTPFLARLFRPQPAPLAEPELQGPLARSVPLCLLRAWLSSLLALLAPRRSRSRQMALVPICKCLFSYTSPHYGFVSKQRFGFAQISHGDFPGLEKPFVQSNSAPSSRTRGQTTLFLNAVAS